MPLPFPKKPGGLKVVSAMMVPRSIHAKSIRWLEEWMVQSVGPHTILWPPVWADHSGRVDVAFSVGFETAKRMDADFYFRFDEDVGFPLLQTDCPIHKCQDFCLHRGATIAEVVDYCEENRRRGFDVTLGITLDEQGNPISQILDSQVDAISDTDIFEVDGGGHGFCAVSGRVLRELPVYSESTGQGGVKFTLWTEQNAKETEDSVFNRWARQHGFRICMDPRINWAHAKWLYLTRKNGAMAKYREALLARPASK